MSSLLAATPPMGWNSWNTFGSALNEAVVRETADALVSSGLAECGYRYVVLDDFWHHPERVNGRLTWNAATFPSGIPALADYVHQRGLLFGIYSCGGTHTCGGMPGSFGYEVQDANTFAEWGVDFLKYDFCFQPPGVTAQTCYRRMGQALRATGRSIVFSLCNWGMEEVHTWGASVGGHLWRTTGDIKDHWPSIYALGFRASRELAAYAGPGRWNDPDMLVVGMRGQGNPEVIEHSKDAGCTDDEYRAHLGMWCLLAAPLFIGCDVRHMDEFTRTLLSNRGLIAINQDPLGLQARYVGVHRQVELWAKPLADGSIAAGLFNTQANVQDHAPLAWETLGLHPDTPCDVRELVTGQDRGRWTRFYNASPLAAHGCEVLRLTVRQT